MHFNDNEHDIVQDNRREKQIIEMFDPVLKARAETDRNPKAPPDATYVANGDPVEVKGCTKKNRNVSTVHGLYRRHLERFRTRHLIIAIGPNLKTGFRIDRLFYANPQVHLQSWLNGLAAKFDEHDEIVNYLMEGKDLSHFRAAKVQKLRADLELLVERSNNSMEDSVSLRRIA